MARDALMALAIAMVVQGCVVSRQSVSPRGGTVRIVPDRSAGKPLSGELIAVSVDSVWIGVSRDSAIVSLPFTQIREVEVQRSRLGSGSAMRYSLIVGLLTGGALTAACASVDGAECGAVLPVVLLSGALWGGVSAASLTSTKVVVPGGAWDSLRAHARFPQGLPDSLPRRGVPLGPRG